MTPEECSVIRRGYAQIDLDAVRYNIDSMCAHISEATRMILVIKTDGYGHGAAAFARIGETDDRIWGYAVACPEEAFELRREGMTKPVLILGYTFDHAYEDMIRQGIRPAVFRDDMLEALSEASLAAGEAAHIHIKVDTGMSRIGIMPDDEGLAFVRKALDTPGIVVEGLFTHFARADETDKRYAIHQLEVFKAFADRIMSDTGYRIPLIHCSNSAGIIELTDANMDLVRAGITLYGLWPSNEVDRDIISLRPVMNLISHIVHIKTVPAGTQISYGGTYETDSERVIATVPVGYGDGIPRGLSNKGEVLVHGKRAPIRGRVCMDQFMIDVTDIPGVSTCDRVTIIGHDGDEEITAEEVGDKSGRFNYELVCDIGKRIPRVYVSQGIIRDIILDRDHIKW